MIYDPRAEHVSPVAANLVAQIETLCTEAERADLEDVARAVDCYLEQEAGCACVDSRALVLMAAHALDSIGATGVARRYLLHGTGMLKPSEWDVTGGDTMWVLDLRQLCVVEGAPLELIFLTGLGIIVDAMADVWDATGGEGTLGLRHISSTATALLGQDVDRAAIEAWGQEIREHCADRLERQRRERGWTRRPAVMDLDVNGG